MTQINIKMMTEEAYTTLQKNHKDVYQNIKDHPSDCSWLSDYLGFEPFEQKNYLIGDFNLKDTDNYNDVAFDNGVVLYNHLHELPRYVLCNPRFWAWIEFEKAYKQAIHAIPLKGATVVKQWWLGGGSRRALMLGVISRSYFRVEISIDENADDNELKYEATKYLFNGLQSGEVYRSLTFRNIGMLQQVDIAYIKCVRDLIEKYKDLITKETIRDLMKDVSRIGSVMLIDDMNSDEIYTALMKKAEKRLDITKS